MKIINLQRKKRNGSSPLRNATALVVALISVTCFITRLGPEVLAQREAAALAAAGFIMPDGAAELLRTGLSEHDVEDLVEQPGQSSSPESSSVAVRDPAEEQSSSTAASAQEGDSSATAQESQSPTASGPGAAIQELAIQNSGVQFQNVFVKNSNQNHKIDIKAELEKQPAVKIQTDGKPQVLIYHTHTTEAYLLQEASSVPAGSESRSTDGSRSVVMVGNAIAAQLRAVGIGVVHDTTIHDSPAYNGSYNRSAQTIAKNLKQYPSIQVTLDIHRDSMTAANGTRYKPTAVINGKKAAQIMILSGCDDDGTLGFPDWEYNLRLGVRTQKQLSDLFPGLARPLNFCARKYNLNMTKGSLLVEVGTEVNTLDEAVYSGELFGEALAKTLKSLK
ncbi:stage II sporulation protein P [Clostridium merdae]|uniref:stage II sporulation protein P n=1 Tax=Clostridium merdae TaxID=1958780 RepID=UPI000A26E82E|nr:stage II sporulation protein P [Clostridium merdae]